MRTIEIIVATIVIILMRHRIIIALTILVFPKSWTIEAMRKALEKIDGA